jgi:hypothetical protein
MEEAALIKVDTLLEIIDFVKERTKGRPGLMRPTQCM